MDLREAEDIKKRWQEYTELYKKDFHNPDSHDGVITHLEPNILGCEVKWTLGSITLNKARGDGGIPVDLFSIFKDDSVKVLHSVCAIALILHSSKVMLKILQARKQQLKLDIETQTSSK